MTGIMKDLSFVWVLLFPLGFDGFQVFGPGEFYQERHGDGSEDRIRGVVGEADRKKTEHQRFGFVPIPKILVKNVDPGNQEGEENDPRWLHSGIHARSLGGIG
jgi:hypothetical protein